MNLDAERITIVRRLAGAIIPEDQDLGAEQTPVAEMIAVVVGSWPEERAAAFAGGLDAVDLLCQGVFGLSIASADVAAVAALAEEIAGSPIWAEFWYGLRALVCLNFYALPEGYQPLGLPGPNIDLGGIPL
jgi:gluconate 2-dehydrogenase subunit 3-like protein